MLQDDPRRPWSLKQRILSRHGHLSNESAADVAEQILSPALRRLYLGNLSRDCNRPELALQAVAGRLEAGAPGPGVPQTEPEISLARQNFVVPYRDDLPPLEKYAHLTLPDDSTVLTTRS